MCGETGRSEISECSSAPPPHTYQRAVKTAALHAPHTRAQGAREKKTETRKQAVLASRGGSLSAVQAARDHPTIRGEDAELSACYRSARDRAWSGGDYYTGHGPQGSRGSWNMVHVDAGAAGAQPGRKGAAEVRRARKRTCHALAEHAMKVAQSADSEGTKRRLDGQVVRHVGIGVGVQHRAGPASSSRSRRRIGATGPGGSQAARANEASG